MSSKLNSDYLIEAHALNAVETSRARDGVWLVKVPKYLAELWQKADSDAAVGKIVMRAKEVNGKTVSEVSLVSDQALTKKVGPEAELLPSEHEFLIQTAANASTSMVGQELSILCEDTDLPDKDQSDQASYKPSLKKLSIFGRVTSRAECRPPPDSKYMKLKARQMIAYNKPKNGVQVLEGPVRNFLPVADHSNNIEYDQRKRIEGKNLRRDKEEVKADLFKAFEQHQYYAVKDLVLITRQPVSYLTEILREIAVCNNKPPHKFMWELKPEYRHYSGDADSKSGL
ncbi:General transcription factor IIF subunit 2 [Cichlidogyrus casuarinus]|uniref:General transcription factor IIF subunit 2 n=1 Tax=Cichlidogyrus casuarinus TaxID=1844966 RepID=A0ABD2QLY1_9PLAT